MSVVLQPQLNLTTGRMVSAEALSRWDHPTLGTIAAGDFVPAAHRLGLDRVLFERVAGQVLEVLRRMRGERIECPSPSMPRRPPCAPRTCRRNWSSWWRGAGLPARLVKVELTEDEAREGLACVVLGAEPAAGARLRAGDGRFRRRHRVHAAVFRHALHRAEDRPRLHRPHASRAGLARRGGGRHRNGAGAGPPRDRRGRGQERDILLLRELGCELAQGFGISPPRPTPSSRSGASTEPAPQAGVKGRTPRYCRGSRSRTSTVSRDLPGSRSQFRPVCRRPRA